MPPPPSRAPTGFSFKRQSSSFSIKAQKSRSAPAEPPLFEDWIDQYDIPREKLRVHLAKVVFPGYSFDGEKIKLKGDHLILMVPRMLTDYEKTVIYQMREPGAS